MADSTKYLVGVFDDDDVVIKAVKGLRGAGVKIFEVFSPYPIHGIDPALGYRHSRLHIAAFIFGCCGLTTAILLQTLTLGVDWPMNIGGKPNVAPPDFVPVSFELTVLFTALGMVGTFLLASRLGPGAQKLVLDPRTTDDKFVVAVELDRNAKFTEAQLTEMMRQQGAAEVNMKEVI